MGIYVNQILASPFWDEQDGQWTVIVEAVWRPPFEYEVIKETRILKYKSKAEADQIHVGDKIETHTYFNWE